MRIIESNVSDVLAEIFSIICPLNLRNIWTILAKFRESLKLLTEMKLKIVWKAGTVAANLNFYSPFKLADKVNQVKTFLLEVMPVVWKKYRSKFIMLNELWWNSQRPISISLWRFGNIWIIISSSSTNFGMVDSILPIKFQILFEVFQKYSSRKILKRSRTECASSIMWLTE